MAEEEGLDPEQENGVKAPIVANLNGGETDYRKVIGAAIATTSVLDLLNPDRPQHSDGPTKVEKVLAAALEGTDTNVAWDGYSSRPRNTSSFTLTTS